MGIGAFDVAGVMQGGWQNLMAAPMGGGALDAPGGAAAGSVGLGAGGAGEEEEEEELALAMAMAGNQVLRVLVEFGWPVRNLVTSTIDTLRTRLVFLWHSCAREVLFLSVAVVLVMVCHSRSCPKPNRGGKRDAPRAPVHDAIILFSAWTKR